MEILVFNAMQKEIVELFEQGLDVKNSPKTLLVVTGIVQGFFSFPDFPEVRLLYAIYRACPATRMLGDSHVSPLAVTSCRWLERH